jgi:hypothetical protein
MLIQILSLPKLVNHAVFRPNKKHAPVPSYANNGLKYN